MKLTKDNYFSRESNQEYMSVSQYKSFLDCEARTIAEIRGEWEPVKTVSMLVGSYVDAYFEGSLPKFTAENLDIFTMKGELRSEYRQAERIIERIEQDELFMEILSGKKQVIKTGELCGVPFKIKIDSYHEGKAIVDLKVMKDFAPVYREGKGRLSFIEGWGYDLQGAVYQHIEGNRLPFYIVAATKEREPDIGIWRINQNELDICLELMRDKVQHFALLKEGIGEPARCEKCDYCKRTKKLTEIKDSRELNYE